MIQSTIFTMWHVHVSALHPSSGKQLNIRIGHRNFSPKYRIIGHRLFYPNRPLATENNNHQYTKPLHLDHLNSPDYPKSGHPVTPTLMPGFHQPLSCSYSEAILLSYHCWRSVSVSVSRICDGIGWKPLS